MNVYVAFLRGMNLGGRRIKNEELRAEFEALGFEEVATFRASGNVIFGASGGESEEMRTAWRSPVASSTGCPAAASGNPHST